jgi:hypothetical protein
MSGIEEQIDELVVICEMYLGFNLLCDLDQGIYDTENSLPLSVKLDYLIYHIKQYGSLK